MTHNDHPNTPTPGLFDGPDRQAMFAEFVRSGIQQLIEAELTAALGAGRYERTEDRTTHRNGTRPKTLATASGDIELAIPKLRQGSFFPALLERRRRIDQALHAVIMEAYVHGVSTRNVDDLVAALGVASGISKSEVSRICAGLGVEEYVREGGVVQRPLTERGDLNVQASTNTRHFRFEDAGRHSECGDEFVDVAGGDSVHVGLHDDRV